MNLLTFAHRGEAQHFLKADNYQSIEFRFNGLFKNNENYLLITGEGLEISAERLNIFFQNAKEKILKVINLGIAGALNEKLELESVYLIDRIMKENEIKIFQSAYKKSNIDCISSLNRVQDEEYKNRLASKAKIVDRELWAIANVSSKFDLPVFSIKIISDYAGKTTGTKRIIRQAKEYSKKLYDYYTNQF